MGAGYTAAIQKNTKLSEILDSVKEARKRTTPSRAPTKPASPGKTDFCTTFAKMMQPRTTLSGDTGGKMFSLSFTKDKLELYLPKEWESSTDNNALAGLVMTCKQLCIDVSFTADGGRAIIQPDASTQSFWAAYWREIHAEKGGISHFISTTKRSGRAISEGKNAARVDMVRILTKQLAVNEQTILRTIPQEYWEVTADRKGRGTVRDSYLYDGFGHGAMGIKTVLQTILETWMYQSQEILQEYRQRVDVKKYYTSFADLKARALPNRKELVPKPGFPTKGRNAQFETKRTPMEPAKISSIVGLRPREIKFVKELFLKHLPRLEDYVAQLEVMNNNLNFWNEYTTYVDDLDLIVKDVAKYYKGLSKVVRDVRTYVKPRSDIVGGRTGPEKRQAWSNFIKAHTNLFEYSCFTHKETSADYIWNSDLLFVPVRSEDDQHIYTKDQYLDNPNLIKHLPNLMAEVKAFSKEKELLIDAEQHKLPIK
jgi:hypothetical protein